MKSSHKEGKTNSKRTELQGNTEREGEREVGIETKGEKLASKKQGENEDK